MFRLILENAGHEVYEAQSGNRGLELLDAENPDVGIIDIGLPDLDGYEVAKRIRERPNGRAMLLLAFTGYGFRMTTSARPKQDSIITSSSLLTPALSRGFSADPRPEAPRRRCDGQFADGSQRTLSFLS